VLSEGRLEHELVEAEVGHQLLLLAIFLLDLSQAAQLRRAEPDRRAFPAGKGLLGDP
jgi:hypothetical protein